MKPDSLIARADRLESLLQELDHATQQSDAHTAYLSDLECSPENYRTAWKQLADFCLEVTHLRQRLDEE